MLSYKIKKQMDVFIKVGKMVAVPFGEAFKEPFIVSIMEKPNFVILKCRNVLQYLFHSFFFGNFNIKYLKK